MKSLSLPARFLGIWDSVRTSFWFLPSTMAAAAVALSFGLVTIDVSLGAETVRHLGWIYLFGPEGARAVLSTIAGSMITVAGLTFSITMLTLQLASSQFGPRLLRSFMRDRGNQLVLGTFTSTFLYWLLVLRTVRGTDSLSFVPHLSVAFGVVLAVCSLAVLIYFIHHVANSIRIETVLAELATETRSAIDRLYPAQLGDDASAPAIGSLVRADFESDFREIFVELSGYVQRVDEEALMKIATDNDLIICVDARPGCFVTGRDRILRAVPGARTSDKIAKALRNAFVIGPDRTPAQDLPFALRRIVDIAQRVLSPGINDPTTALYCIERLEEALCRLAEREIPSPIRADVRGQPRILTGVCKLEELACPAIAAIARYGIRDADVVRKLQELIEKLSGIAEPSARDAIVALGASIRTASRSKLIAFDRDDVQHNMFAGGQNREPKQWTLEKPDGNGCSDRRHP